MKTMKILIASLFFGAGLALTACDDDELIVPNELSSGSATKQTLDTDSTSGPGSANPLGGTGIGGFNGNGGNGNGNGGNGNGGNGDGITGP